MRRPLSMAIHAALIAGILIAPRARSDTFEVTRGDDPAPNGCLAGDCSLREALEASGSTPGADTIVLGSGLYNVTIGELQVLGEVAIQGAGSTTTNLVATGAFDLLHVMPLGRLTLSGIQMSSSENNVFAEHSEAVLDDVRTPADGGIVLADSVTGGSASLRVTNSNLGDAVGCAGLAGTCHISDSTLNEVLVLGDQVELTLDRVEVAGPPSYYGVTIASNAGGSIRDSTIRNQITPLWVSAQDAPTADVYVTRTRFIGNFGPMHGDRDSGIYLDDVEFRDNIVDDDHLTYPAALIAENGPGWRISRALFVGNRGGGGINSNLDGAVVRALPGANLVMTNVTFENNTFRSDVVDGFGDAIGVPVTSNVSTLVWLVHATMHRSNSVPANTPGSLLTVRGAAANVRVFNSLMAGTCAMVSGGVMFQAEGNVESPGNTCEFASADNLINVPFSQLQLSPLADHGGFTETFEPQDGSALLDNAVPTWCYLTRLIDQRRYVRPAQGLGCDVGAVEAGAIPDTIFSDDFE